MPPPRFCLSLLGRFELTGPDGVVDVPNRKLAGLLAYLACTAPRPQRRERLSALLWGSHFDTQAKQNLRQALFRLRKVLGQDALDSEGEVVSLNAATVLCDVSRFEALVRDGSRDALSAAADLYRGPLIDDVAISEEGWSEWLTGERQRLLELALGAMVELGNQELIAGRAELALKAGQRAVALNNMREDAHRLIVQALAGAGRKAEALKHYQDLVVLLKRELNTEPDAATKSLVAELRSTQPPSRSPAVSEIVEPPLPQPDPPSALPFADMRNDPGQGVSAESPAARGDEESSAEPTHSGSSEQRQLTVMACSLVGPATPSARLDPEDMRNQITTFHQMVADAVARFDGYVAQYLSDGVLVYFGYPAAHELDAERAVRAGLAIVDAVGALKTGLEAPRQASAGIATGLVVIGEQVGTGETRQRLAIGGAPRVAGQLLDVAGPGEVVIAASTRRLVGRMFDCRALGANEAKGLPPSAEAWQVRGETAGVSRFEALRASVPSPLIGRDEEIDLLLRRWERARGGDGQVVLISGEAGLGKSRIMAELETHLHSAPHLRLPYFCSPYHQDSALFPVIEQLGRAAGFAANDPPETRWDELEALLALAAPKDDDVALLADLLSLPPSTRHPLPKLSPQRKKEAILVAMLRQLEGLARDQPVLVVFEDAHWIDPTSRELLDLAVERVRDMPAMLVVTFRPEFQPSWVGLPQVTMLALNRLGRRDRTTLVKHVAAGKSLPQEVMRQIVDRTDGVPLFIEELTKNVLESGLLREESDRYVLDGDLPPLSIPTTLHASLLARLDRLASVRRLAQIGAVIGREFSYTLLHAVSRLPEDELRGALARLVASELVSERGMPPDAVYTFKHALVQDAAYGSLLRSSRQQLHALIAEALEAHHPELMDSQPELLAQHYAEAGLVEKSVACWDKAGHGSAARLAMVEAAAQFQKGLGQLALLPDNPERQQRELVFLKGLGAALQSIKGYGAPETGQIFARARKLWEQLGFPPEFLQIPYGQSRHHTARGELDRAQWLAEDLLRLSRQRDHRAGLVLGHLAAGRNQFIGGRFASARSHLEEVLVLYDPISHRSLADQTGTHLHVVAQAHLEIVLFGLGFPDQAMAHSSAAIAEARRLAHPPSLAASLALGNILVSLVGDNVTVDKWAHQLVAVATEQGFPFRRAMGTVSRGWVKVKNGDVAEGMSLMRSGAAAYRATGAEVWMPHFIGLLASGCEIAGQFDEAVTLVDEALQMAERTGEHWFTAELHRHKGQLLLRQGHAEAAETLYRKALGIAEEQRAKLWELRATASLARLRRDQGRREEARNLLAPVYGWFTEGFGTPDLKDAKTLLDQLV